MFRREARTLTRLAHPALVQYRVLAQEPQLGVLYIVTAPLWLLFFLPGWIAWGLISIWFLYRIVRGMVAMNKSQAVDA